MFFLNFLPPRVEPSSLFLHSRYSKTWTPAPLLHVFFTKAFPRTPIPSLKSAKTSSNHPTCRREALPAAGDEVSLSIKEEKWLLVKEVWKTFIDTFTCWSKLVLNSHVELVGKTATSLMIISGLMGKFTHHNKIAHYSFDKIFFLSLLCHNQ